MGQLGTGSVSPTASSTAAAPINATAAAPTQNRKLMKKGFKN